MYYLNSAEIIKLIADYLEEITYSYAIMIDGGWGSGKTYFVNKKLIPELEKKEKKAIYISLYGLKDAEEISKELFSTIAEKRIGKKLAPAFNTGFKMVSEIIGNKIGSETANNANLTDVFSPFLDYSKYFFVFDDLERCSMPINDVLGYINHFVEQNESKVVIIANQEEINSVELQNNLEWKYFLAIQDSINWPTKEEKMSFIINANNNNKNKALPLNLEELRVRNKYLFDDNALYKKIKEKLVGKTIYYQPNLEEIIPVIFNVHSYNNGIEAKENFYINTILDSFNKEKYGNLRTLQFALHFFSKVVMTLDSNKQVLHDDIYHEVMQEVIRSIIKVSINHKRGEPNYKWSEDSEYGLISNQMWNYYISFRFVHDFIYFSEFNNERIQMILSKYIREKHQEVAMLNDPINKLRYYFEMEDEEIETEIKRLYENLKSNEYDSDSYRLLISLLYVLKGIDIQPVPISKFINIIKSNIVAGKSIRTFEEPLISDISPCYDEYVVCLNELYSLQDSCTYNKTIKSINAIFELKDGWGNAFYEYYEENRNDILQSKEFFSQIDIDRLREKIYEAPVKELSDFRRGINTIYSFSNLKDYFENDIHNLLELKKLLQIGDFKGKSKKNNINSLIIIVNSILEKLEYLEQVEE